MRIANPVTQLVWIANPDQREHQGDTEHPPRQKDTEHPLRLEIDETAFAAALGKATNMSAPKVNYVMMETAEYVMRRLFEGSSVSVPKLGTFKLSLKSHAVIQKRQAGVSAMDSITIKFQPCVEIKRKLQIPNLQFKEVDASPKSKKL